MGYEKYLRLMEEQARIDPAGLDESERERIEFTRLNLHRSRRIQRTWKPSEELLRLLEDIDRPQTWLAVTEPWCGDSAQCLPQIATLADHSPRIELVILLRDENPELMDRYLTDGKRSIPIVVAQDAEGREIFRWGPRPRKAQEVFDAARSEGLDKPDILHRLHLFYGRDRGRALDAELVAVLRRAVISP